LSQNPRPTEAQIRQAMNGHLCRCGTYPRAMQAIQLAARTMAGDKL
jgi:aerobic-type carbon monoxide dehydrogenase small subunit (CoxS/CutS family)